MSEAKHTPGPWQVDIGAQLYVYENDATGRTICKISTNNAMPRSSEEDLANAYLIAAAPELLDALKFINERCNLYGPADRAREMADAAIAKAEGRS